MNRYLKIETLTSRILFLFVPYLVFLSLVNWAGFDLAAWLSIGTGVVQFLGVWFWKKRIYPYPIVTVGSIGVLLAIERLISVETFNYLMPVFLLIIPLLLMHWANRKRRLLNNEILSRKRRDLFVTYANVEMFAFYLNAFYLFLAIHILGTITFLVIKHEELYRFETGMGIVYMLLSFVVFSVVYFIITRTQLKNEEWLSIVDESGGVKGKATRTQCHGTTELMHPVVHIHLIKGKSIYLQKRPLSKDIQPGKWDTAVGGHLGFGEDITAGLLREAKEELGLTDVAPRFLIKYVWETEREKELVYTFYLKNVESININHNEVDDGKYWPVHQIKENLGKGVFTPNFEKEFEFIEQIFF